MKKFVSVVLSVAVMLIAFTACAQQKSDEGELTVVVISLSDEEILVGGEKATEKSTAAVYVSNDIIYYEKGKGSGYGDGKKTEEHSRDEADRHTVINITQPGNYMVTGSISHGQIAVNLGEDAENNENKVVNLILNNADITCTVAPAIVCYSAYECSSDDEDDAVMDVDTSAAGFNITIADGSVNNISGGHVAKIYEPGTEDKLHKYDAAIESLVSLNINGSDGVLNVKADNEGIETKLHMTINGGTINIDSCDDALNAGEDGVSVITVNGGKITADSNGGQEGDGIDSNGWLVINGGQVSAFGCGRSMDSGLDSDNGIYINGGTVYATGNMYDRISDESGQTAAVFSFKNQIGSEEYIMLKSSSGDAVAAFNSTADHSVMVYSSPLLTEDSYTLYKAEGITGEEEKGIYVNITETEGEIQMAHTSQPEFKGAKGQRPARPEGEMPEGMTPPDIMFSDENERPQGGGDMVPPQDMIPEESELGIPPSDIPSMDGNGRPMGFGEEAGSDFVSSATETEFTVKNGLNMFSFITEYKE